MSSHSIPSGADLVLETVRVARLVAAGEPGHAHHLVDLGRALARRVARTVQPWTDSPDDTPSLAIQMMRQANRGTVWPAHQVRDALAERPAMAPYDYLRSLGLETLPRLSLPVPDTFDLVVYRASAPATSLLWNSIADGDETLINQVVTRLTTLVLHGPDTFGLDLRD